MQVAQQQIAPQGELWHERATRRSNEISLAFDVFLAYGGQIAMWVLFACMISNIVQIIPGLGLPPTVSNIILAIQAIMLDLGGFSLNSIAKKATDPVVRKKGLGTGNTLIGIMILTMLLLTVKVELSNIEIVVKICNYAESGLILARVALTVFYLHVIHELRHDQQENPTAPATPPVPAPTQEDLQKQIETALTPLINQFKTDLESQLLQFQNQQPEPAIDYSEIMKLVLPQIRKTVISELPNNTKLLELPTPRQRAKPVLKTRDERLADAYEKLYAEDKKPTGEALAKLAKCSKVNALAWLKDHTTEPQTEDAEPEKEPTEVPESTLTSEQTEPENRDQEADQPEEQNEE